jgi:hypothetical protein
MIVFLSKRDEETPLSLGNFSVAAVESKMLFN